MKKIIVGGLVTIFIPMTLMIMVDIVKELYDGLEWHKEENTYFVRNQWNGIPYSVRPYEKGRD